MIDCGIQVRKQRCEEKVHYRRLRIIDECIRNGSYPSVQELASRCEVSERTISRDIDELKIFLEAPIDYDRMKKGYFYTQPFTLGVPMLSEGEFFSLALLERVLEGYRNTPLEESLKRIFKKLIHSLPETISVESHLLDQMTFISEPLAPIDKESFTLIFKAITQSRELSFEYRPLQKTSYMRRQLKPYHAVCQKGNWYVIGEDQLKNEVRIFSFSRMAKVEVLESRFVRPKDFDVRQYLDKNMGVWLSARKELEIRLRFAPEVGTFAREHQWHENQQIQEAADGSVEVSFSTTQLPEVKRWVLGQGASVRVLEPPELVEEIQKELKALADIYGSEGKI